MFLGQRALPLGEQQIGSGALVTAQALNLTGISGANAALISATTAAVRFRDDGTAPTASQGVVVPSGANPFEYTGNIAALQFIAASAGAIVDVSLYKIVG